MTPQSTIDTTLALYAGGVSSFVDIARRFTGTDLSLLACGTWSADDTVRHVLAVSRWYHNWLDRAEAADAAIPFPRSEMDEQNERELADLQGVPPSDALVAFEKLANGYTNRVVDLWDLPYGYPSGTVTAGLHCGIAATEWHLHAWDLSTALGPEHRPEQPGALFAAAGACVAAAQGGVWGLTTRALIPVGARIRPWQTLLKRSGRG